jgi:hypothetical protein
MAKVRIYSADMSRRNVLRAVAAVGLAVATTDCAFAAKPKRSQADVNYQDHPHGAERCDNCAPFVAPDSCKTVQGTVSAQGWCKIYVEK